MTITFVELEAPSFEKITHFPPRNGMKLGEYRGPSEEKEEEAVSSADWFNASQMESSSGKGIALHSCLVNHFASAISLS